MNANEVDKICERSILSQKDYLELCSIIEINEVLNDKIGVEFKDSIEVWKLINYGGTPK